MFEDVIAPKWIGKIPIGGMELLVGLCGCFSLCLSGVEVSIGGIELRVDFCGIWSLSLSAVEVFIGGMVRVGVCGFESVSLSATETSNWVSVLTLHSLIDSAPGSFFAAVMTLAGMAVSFSLRKGGGCCCFCRPPGNLASKA